MNYDPARKLAGKARMPAPSVHRAASCARKVVLLLALAIMPLGAQDTSVVRPVAGAVLVDFQDVELRAVITALAEAARINVSYGDLPSRRITLRLRQPVARADIPALLRSIALNNGLRVTEEGGLLRFDAAGTPVVAGPTQQGEELRLFVHRLRHARAARLAGTLQAIFGGEGAGMPQATGLSRDPLSSQLRRQQLPPVGADTLRGAIPLGAPGSSVAAALRGDVQIVPDETTNSLLIRAQPADYEVIRQAVEALDLRPMQAVIEVLIAEVRRSRDLDVGVSARVQNRDGTRRAELRPGDTASANDFILRLTSGGRVNVDVAIRALATRGDVRILSRPVIVAQNNQEAKILVGSQRPFVQVFRSLPTDAGVRDQVVQYRDVGTSLTILPTINPDGYVNLLLSQEVSSATAETQFGAPVISTREASTHLFVRDGQTAVIGGLVDRQSEDTRSGIPFLSDIPLLGALFRGTRQTNTTSELFLFLTPHIVRDDQDVDRVREQIEARPPVKEEVGKSPPVVSPRSPK
jgi:type II secretory pathway component GspD/PulD (secretin)